MDEEEETDIETEVVEEKSVAEVRSEARQKSRKSFYRGVAGWTALAILSGMTAVFVMTSFVVNELSPIRILGFVGFIAEVACCIGFAAAAIHDLMNFIRTEIDYFREDLVRGIEVAAECFKN